jgi:predicted N-formylglutamate amidohydrolase
VWPHPPLHAAYARCFRWMGCQAARRGAPAALLEVRQEAMHGTDVRTDEATRLQKSLKATAERARGKIGHHCKEAIIKNYHKALEEIAQQARKVAE